MVQLNFDSILSICHKNKEIEEKGVIFIYFKIYSFMAFQNLWFNVLDKFLSLQSGFETSTFQDFRFQKFQGSFTNMLSILLEEIVKNVPLIHFVKVLHFIKVK
jgi:hypothetical protein